MTEEGYNRYLELILDSQQVSVITVITHEGSAFISARFTRKKKRKLDFRLRKREKGQSGQDDFGQ